MNAQLLMTAVDSSDVYNYWRVAYDVIHTVFTLAVAIYVWWTNGKKVTRDAIEALEEDFGKLKGELTMVTREIEGLATQRELTEVKKDIENLPHRADLHKVHNRIDEVSQVLHRMNGTLEALNRNNELMMTFLLNRPESKER